MATKEKKNGGDFVLESRHLVGLFMLLVVIFGVVFTLGYLLGRSQYDSQLHAAFVKPVVDDPPAAKTSAKSKEKQEDFDQPPPPSQNKSDWDFYHSAEPKTTEDHLQPVKKSTSAAQPASASAPRPAVVPAKFSKPAQLTPDNSGALVPKGAIMLQVAAVTSQEDALALAQALQQKKFPAFVMTPSTDKFYRVQVGPYPNNQSATAARLDLEAKGFKTIVKK